MFNFSSKKSIGLDISDHSIEIVQVAKYGGKLKLLNFGRTNLREGIIVKGKIIDSKKLAEALKGLINKSKIDLSKAEVITFGVPESQVYIHSFFIPSELIAKEEIEDLIKDEIKKNIPLKEEELIYNYKILFETKEGIHVLSVIANKKNIEVWQDFFQAASINISNFDIETLASFRNLDIKKLPVIVADLGSVTTNFSIFSKKGLLYNSQIYIGGDKLTNIFSRFEKIDLNAAEALKKKQGLNISDKNIKKALCDVLEPIKNELKQTASFFEDKHHEEIQEIIFIGGTSQTKGIIRYFQDGLNIPISIGESKLFSYKISPKFIEAIGLSIRGLEKKWDRADPLLELPNTKIKIEKTNILDKEDLENRNKESLDQEEESNDTLAPKIKLLAVIIVIGLIAILAAYFFRAYEKRNKADILQNKIKENITQEERYFPEIPNEEPPILEEKTNISTSSNIDILIEINTASSAIVSAEEKTVEIKKLIIKNTETGWLNVRNGPGTNFQIIEKIYPGQEYNFIEENNNWVKIELNQEKQGWIISKYTDIQNENSTE